jgi:hypothetical protein
LATPPSGVDDVLGVYFVCAVSADVRVRDPQIGGAVSFLVLAADALIADLGYHGRGDEGACCRWTSASG